MNIRKDRIAARAAARRQSIRIAATSLALSFLAMAMLGAWIVALSGGADVPDCGALAPLAFVACLAATLLATFNLCDVIEGK